MPDEVSPFARVGWLVAFVRANCDVQAPLKLTGKPTTAASEFAGVTTPSIVPTEWFGLRSNICTAVVSRRKGTEYVERMTGRREM